MKALNSIICFFFMIKISVAQLSMGVNYYAKFTFNASTKEWIQIKDKPIAANFFINKAVSEIIREQNNETIKYKVLKVKQDKTNTYITLYTLESVKDRHTLILDADKGELRFINHNAQILEIYKIKSGTLK